ncbi:hypothetical protein ABNF57_03725 [Paenibacillus larvae]
MNTKLSKEDVQKWVGQHIVAYKKDGSQVSGKLVWVKGDKLYLSANNGKEVHTKAVIPLVLFDLLAIGTGPAAFGGWGFGPYGYGGGFFGGPGPFFW